MYTFVRSYIKKGSQWERLDLAAYRIDAILEYDDVKVVLEVTATGEEIVIMKDDFLPFIPKGFKNNLLQTWIGSFTENILPATDRPSNFQDVRKVKFLPLYRTGAIAGTGNYFTSTEGKDVTVSSDRADGIRYSLNDLRSSCLFVINGKIHRTEVRSDQIFILNGNERLYNEEDYNISIIDFGDLGGIDTIEFNDTSLESLPRTEEDLAADQVRIKVMTTEEHLGKTPFFVANGNLFLMDGSIKQVDSRTFIITMDYRRVVTHIASETRDNQTYDFAYAANVRGGGIVKSSIDLVKYLKTTVSMLCFIKQKNLSMRTETFRNVGIRGLYSVYRIPSGLLFFTDTTLAPFAIHDYNHSRAQIGTIDNRKKEYLFETIPWNELDRIPLGRHAPRKVKYMDVVARDVYYF